MENVFISELNENALKTTPTDVTANTLLKCRCMHNNFRHASLGSSRFLAAVEDDLSLVFIASTLLTFTAPSHVASAALTAKQNIR